MKSASIWKMVGVVVLVVATLLAIRVIDRIPVRRLTSLAGMSVSISDQERTPEPTSIQVSPLTAQVPTLSLGTVAVQTFSGSVLIRSGSGTIVSSDGLIVTTVSVAPAGATVYQVVTVDGTVVRGAAVWRDVSGLVLLKVNASDLDSVSFDQEVPLQVGADVAVIGAFMRLSRYVPVMLDAQIPYVVDNRDIPLSVDRAFSNLLSASRVIDGQGRSLGLLQWGPGYARMIPANIVNAVIARYLAIGAKR